MQKRVFHVTAVWDAEAQVFCSKSDIKGLVLEAPTLEEFQSEMEEWAPEMIAANHSDEIDLETTPPEKLITTIIWEPPVEQTEAA